MFQFFIFLEKEIRSGIWTKIANLLFSMLELAHPGREYVLRKFSEYFPFVLMIDRRSCVMIQYLIVQPTRRTKTSWLITKIFHGICTCALANFSASSSWRWRRNCSNNFSLSSARLLHRDWLACNCTSTSSSFYKTNDNHSSKLLVELLLVLILSHLFSFVHWYYVFVSIRIQSHWFYTEKKTTTVSIYISAWREMFTD